MRAVQGLVPSAIAAVLSRRSPSTIRKHLLALEREGRIEPTPRYLLEGLETRRDDTEPTYELSGDRRRDVLSLCRQGLVPLAVADVLDVTVETVRRYLRELERSGEIERVPRFLDGAPR